MPGTLNGHQHDAHDYVSRTQLRIGGSLWTTFQNYHKNSPLFIADKVTCPLLMMHNRLDGAVDWSQAIEYYTALRYLSKKVWMLEYEDEDHEINNPLNQRDYTLRLNQFFDHYLKKFPPAKWMTQGRPAELKGIEDRFELDPEGSCGDSCKICREKKYQDLEILDVMNPNTIKYRVDANMKLVKNH